MWPQAREFVVRAGWEPVETPIFRGKVLPPLIMWRDPLYPDRKPVYLHEAESRQDWREWTVRHVMES